MKRITLEKDIRAFTRTGVRTLSNGALMWFRKGETIIVGEPIMMLYDHGDKETLPVINTVPQRYVIKSELTQDPWHVHSPHKLERN